MDNRLRRYPRSLLEQQIPPDHTYKGSFENRVDSDALQQWPPANVGSKEHWSGQSFSPQAQQEFDAIANIPHPPVTPMGQQLGIEEIIKMLELQRLMQQGVPQS